MQNGKKKEGTMNRAPYIFVALRGAGETGVFDFGGVAI
jgi:hypothetical protein